MEQFVATLITEFQMRHDDGEILTAKEYIDMPDEQQIEVMLTDGSDLLSHYQQLDMDLNFNELWIACSGQMSYM